MINDYRHDVVFHEDPRPHAHSNPFDDTSPPIYFDEIGGGAPAASAPQGGNPQIVEFTLPDGRKAQQITWYLPSGAIDKQEIKVQDPYTGNWYTFSSTSYPSGAVYDSEGNRRVSTDTSRGVEVWVTPDGQPFTKPIAGLSPSVNVSVSTPLSTSAALTREQIESSVAAAGGTIRDYGGILVATFPDRTVVEYKPTEFRDGRIQYTASIKTSASKYTPSPELARMLGASKQYPHLDPSRPHFMTGVPFMSVDEIIEATGQGTEKNLVPGQVVGKYPGSLVEHEEDLPVLYGGLPAGMPGLAIDPGTWAAGTSNIHLQGVLEYPDSPSGGKNVGIGIDTAQVLNQYGLTSTGNKSKDLQTTLALINAREKGIKLPDVHAIKNKEALGLLPKGAAKQAVNDVRKFLGLPPDPFVYEDEEVPMFQEGGEILVGLPNRPLFWRDLVSFLPTSPRGQLEGLPEEGVDVVKRTAPPKGITFTSGEWTSFYPIKEPLGRPSLELRRPRPIPPPTMHIRRPVYSPYEPWFVHTPDGIYVKPPELVWRSDEEGNLGSFPYLPPGAPGEPVLFEEGGSITVNPADQAYWDVYSAQLRAIQEREAREAREREEALRLMNIGDNQYVHAGPLYMLNAQGELVGVAGEAGPEKVTIEPKRRQYQRPPWGRPWAPRPWGSWGAQPWKEPKVKLPSPEVDSVVGFATGGEILVGDVPPGAIEDYPGAGSAWVWSDVFQQWQQIKKNKVGTWETTGKFRDGPPPAPPEPPPALPMPAESAMLPVLAKFGVQPSDPSSDQRKAEYIARRANDLALQGLPQLLAEEIIRNEMRTGLPSI